MDRYFQTIVVPVDFSEKSLVAVEHAIVYAERLNKTITLMNVVDDSSPLFAFLGSGSARQKVSRSMADKLDVLAESYREKTDQKIYTFVDSGKVYQKIIDFAEQELATFIIVGRNGASLEAGKKNLGSQTSQIVRQAKCPVITINQPTRDARCDTIVLPLDLTRETTKKVNKAIEMARLFGATIKAVSAQSTTEKAVYERLKNQIEQVKDYIEARNIYCTTDIIRSEMDETTSLAGMILNYSKQVKGDLLMIMTQRESNWVEMFIGSSAQEIMRNAKIPVMSIVP